MRRNSPALPLLLLIFLITAPVAGHAQPPVANLTGSGETSVMEDPVDNTAAETETHPVRDSGIGCATGAVLGSVLPGLGNAVGCVVGGIVGWWFS